MTRADSADVPACPGFHGLGSGGSTLLPCAPSPHSSVRFSFTLKVASKVMAEPIDEIVARANEAAALAGKKAARITRFLLAIVLFVGLIALAVPSLSTWIPRWLLAIPTAVAVVPTVWEVIDRLSPATAEDGRRPPLARLARVVEVRVKRRFLRLAFAARGIEEAVEAAQAGDLLSESELAYFAAADHRRRALHRRWLIGSVVGFLVASFVLAWVVWPTSSNNLHIAVGRTFELADVYDVTIPYGPTCRVSSVTAEAACSVSIRFVNVSGESQVISGLSFGTIGPKAATFYRVDGIDNYQDYAVAAVQHNQYFSMRSARFEVNDLRAGEAVDAIFDFDVRDDVTTLDEVQFAVWGGRRIHIHFA